MIKRVIWGMVMLSAACWQGCESEETPGPVDCNANPVLLEVVAVQDSDCGASNGSIEVAASGGSGNYSFLLDEGKAQTSAVFTGLAAGSYEVKVLDNNECSAIAEANVKNANGVNITFNSTSAGCGTATGTLTVTAIDGIEPYQYMLDQGSFGASNSFSALSAGEHHLTVKDASGCEVRQVVRISSGVSFSNTISGIITNNCAVSGCHNGSQFPDLRVLKNIRDNASSIKTLTQNGTMPKQGDLTQEEINLIACWVDDGAPDN